jgi:hypothetical protein
MSDSISYVKLDMSSLEIRADDISSMDTELPYVSFDVKIMHG